MSVGAVLVVVLSLAMLSQGGSLRGWLPPDLLLILVIALCVAGVMLSIPIEKKALKNVVQAGVPVKWVIDAPDGSINGRNNRISIPDYGIEYTFHMGENVIEFTPAGYTISTETLAILGSRTTSQIT